MGDTKNRLGLEVLLEKAGKITSARTGIYKYYFPKEDWVPESNELLLDERKKKRDKA